MYNIIKHVTPLFLITILCACTLGGANVNVLVEEYETDDECVYVERTSISGLSDKEFENKINTSLDEVVNSKIKSFLKNSQDAKQRRNGKAKLDISQEVKYDKNSVLSFV